MTSCRIDHCPGGHRVKNVQTCRTFLQAGSQSCTDWAGWIHLSVRDFSFLYFSLLNDGCLSVTYSRVRSEFIYSCEGNKSVIPDHSQLFHPLFTEVRNWTQFSQAALLLIILALKWHSSDRQTRKKCTLFQTCLCLSKTLLKGLVISVSNQL